MSSAKLTSSKKFFVRLSLVTSSTLATIIGAQSLASLDLQSTAQAPIAAALPADSIAAGSTLLNSSTAAQSAPTITIIRHAGEASEGSGDDDEANNSQILSGTVTISPPVPVQVVPSNSVVVQLPVQPRTRSSR